MDKNVAKDITTKSIHKKNAQYFSPELKPFINECWFPKNLHDEIMKELPENFYQDRKIGENNSYICKLIQQDLVKDFIIYINQNNIPLDDKIPNSFYETNICCIKKKLSLIEYAAFYGSIQIFKHLQLNQAKLTDSLIILAIHSENAELINLLEENNKYMIY